MLPILDSLNLIHFSIVIIKWRLEDSLLLLKLRIASGGVKKAFQLNSYQIGVLECWKIGFLFRTPKFQYFMNSF
ncbi:MAG: hypothetical protein D6813_15540 [Calditrichaeota bacterium]|nr:MAG: hypothetical protein D6813_15540 [Calditrichota bacterium]